MRKINIVCVQETKWIGTKAWDVVEFKLCCSRGSRDRKAVDIIVVGDFRECVVDVRRISDRIMTIKVDSLIVDVISLYAP